MADFQDRIVTALTADELALIERHRKGEAAEAQFDKLEHDLTMERAVTKSLGDRLEAAEAQLAAAREAVAMAYLFILSEYRAAPDTGLTVTSEARVVFDALCAALASAAPARTFPLGAVVHKVRGSSWRGRVVGYYSTALTPDGICVESDHEPGSVQIYPATALAAGKTP